MTETAQPCELCGEPMPAGESMFKYHGYSGLCPRPPKATETAQPKWTWTETPEQIDRSVFHRVLRVDDQYVCLASNRNAGPLYDLIPQMAADLNAAEEQRHATEPFTGSVPNLDVTKPVPGFQNIATEPGSTDHVFVRDEDIQGDELPVRAHCRGDGFLFAARDYESATRAFTRHSNRRREETP